MTLPAHTPDTDSNTGPGQGAPGADRAATATEAVRFGGTVVRWRTRCDNYEPPRIEDAGYGIRYAQHPVNGGAGFVFWPGPDVRDAHSAIYVLDDGASALPYYVVGWSDRRGELMLHPFPTNPDGQTRADRPGEEIDYSTWIKGPTRAYHLKITAA